MQPQPRHYTIGAHLATTTSTNDDIRRMALPADGSLLAVWADHQTAGRGQGTNRWESAPGQNLLCSLAADCRWWAPREQFVLSMAGGLALHGAVASVLRQRGASVEPLRLKWPNDLYYGHAKLAGTLIETQLSSAGLQRVVWGIGLNVNQERFLSDAPNPIALRTVAPGPAISRQELLARLAEGLWSELQRLQQGERHDTIRRYHAALYRHDARLHAWADQSGTFLARIGSVAPSGLITLITAAGQPRCYELKQVSHVITPHD